MSTRPAIYATGVTVAIGRRTIVDRCDLTVGAGDWVTIVGPNGAGKTTFLRALTGLAPATGRIELHGTPVASLSHRERARTVALVPQTPMLPPAMTVAHYVLLGRTAHLGPLGRESRARPRRGRRRAGATRAHRVHGSPPRHAVGRGATACAHRPRARPGGVDPGARRADDGARHRPSARHPGAGRRPAPTPGPDRAHHHARPDARGPVRRSPGAAGRRAASPFRAHLCRYSPAANCSATTAPRSTSSATGADSSSSRGAPNPTGRSPLHDSARARGHPHRRPPS